MLKPGSVQDVKNLPTRYPAPLLWLTRLWGVALTGVGLFFLLALFAMGGRGLLYAVVGFMLVATGAVFLFVGRTNQ